jgi:hypothetical protein
MTVRGVGAGLQFNSEPVNESMTRRSPAEVDTSELFGKPKNQHREERRREDLLSRFS